MKPNALVIGPMKAGTTWIHEYLAWRGDVALPNGLKETFFFDRHFDRGTDWYENFFDAAEDGEATKAVEVAPSLFHAESAPGRVRDVLGPIPLIVATREPVSRSWSHYAHLRRKGYTQAPLKEAVIEFPEILGASDYHHHIARWQEALPESRISVLDLEVLKRDVSGYTRSLCEALDLPVIVPDTELGKANASGTPPSYWLAKLSRKSTELLRSLGAHSLINLGKNVGLKRLAYGKDGKKGLKASEEDLAFLAEALHKDTSNAAVS